MKGDIDFFAIVFGTIVAVFLFGGEPDITDSLIAYMQAKSTINKQLDNQ